jgi:hypothetical protein
MDALLNKIELYSYALEKLHLYQIAGDYGYFVAWMRSTEWNNGEHLAPHPAGENTIDEYSHNCPIPYYVNSELFRGCNNLQLSKSFIMSIKQTLYDIKPLITCELENIAVNCYIEYSENLLVYLNH